MMILMWLAPVVLMIGALAVFRTSLQRESGFFQEAFLKLPDSSGIPRLLVTSKFCSLGLAGFLPTQYSAVALLSARVFSRRYGILLLCLSAAGLWTGMLGVALAWNVDGSLILGLALGLFLLSRWIPRLQTAWTAVAGLGFFLLGARWALEKQSILLSVLGESELHFLLADGRLPAQLLWMAASFLLTVLLGVEAWALCLALVLLAAGSLSLNGAVALVLGELLAHVWGLVARSRKLNQDTRQVVLSYALVSSAGLGIAFVVTGFLRDFFQGGVLVDGDPLWEKSLQFLIMIFVIALCQSLVALGWGHFAAKKKVEDVQKGEYFPTLWISRDLIGRKILALILGKLQERLAYLKTQQEELKAAGSTQIPRQLMLDHEQEVKLLSQWLPQAKGAAGPCP